MNMMGTFYAELTEEDYRRPVITIPPGVKELGSQECRWRINKNSFLVTKVNLPESIRGIREETFDYCSKLAEINFPEGLEFIGDAAFCHCNFESITLPAHVTLRGCSSFGCNKRLKSVWIHGDDPAPLEKYLQACYGCENAMLIFEKPPAFATNLLSWEDARDRELFYKRYSNPNQNDIKAICIPAGTCLEGGPQGDPAFEEYKAALPIVEYFRTAEDVFASPQFHSLISQDAIDRPSRIIEDAEPIKPNGSVSEQQETPKSLEKYLKALYDAEIQIMQLTDALKHLTFLSVRNQNRSQFTREYSHLLFSSSERKYSDYYRRATLLRAGAMNPSGLKESIGDPPSPVACLTIKKPLKPEAPVYRTPTLFNKKKVAEENERIKKQYEANLCAYEEQMKLWKECLAKEQQYKMECEQWENRKRALAGKQARELEIEAEENKKRDIENASSSIFLASDAYSNYLGQLIEDTETELSKTAGILKGLYEQDVVFPKYRNLPAVATMYEYIASGRCESLQGPDGAYNLYESEIRANRVIEKLEDISESLDQVKANQYMLYEAVQNNTASINRLKATVSDAGHEIVNTINEGTCELQKMQPKIDSIAQTSSETMQWAKRTAGLVDSLGYLIAFDALT